MDEYYTGLKTEISFWVELLDQSDSCLPSPEYKRMQQALQLARCKLSDYELTLTRSVGSLPEH